MSAGSETFAGGIGGAGLLDRERIIAKPGFNRWLVPPAALAIHLCIGMAYGFSVFWLPLSRSLGIDQPAVRTELIASTIDGLAFNGAHYPDRLTPRRIRQTLRLLLSEQLDRAPDQAVES